jgi:hypothetical protein
MLFPLEANDMLFFEPMLIETYACYNGSKPYFLIKEIIFSIGRNVDTNEYFLHLFYG